MVHARLMLAGAVAAALVPLAVPGTASAQRTDAVIGMTLEPPYLDPTAGTAAAIDEVTYTNVFEGLTRIDETGAVVPGLAESWAVSDDGLTYTFQLRSGVTFHDGTAFDSADVKFSLERAMAPDSTNAQKQYFEPIASVETPSPTEVVVTLSEPDGLFLFNMGQGDAVIVAPESADTNTTDPVGTGPFRFAEWVQGDRVELVKNPDFRDADAIALERITFRFISDAPAQVAALLAGDVDAFSNMGAPETLVRFESDPRFVVDVGTTEGETVMSLNWRREPFDDPLVRQAVMHAIDRQALVDGAMFGYGTPIGSHFAPHHPAYVDLTGLYPHDPERAKELLAEAGHPDGFEATFKLPPPVYARRGGEIIQAQLAEIGIRVDLEPVEWAQWLEQVFTNHDYDMTIVSHVEPLDIGIYGRGLNYYFGYRSEAFGEILAALDDTTDESERRRLYGQAQEILGRDLASIFLFQLPKIGVRAAKLEGMWSNSPVPANDMTNAHWVE
ncbi:MAG TPA: ABC transporter substrate-binding protein [Alphaproteobacteria bacterium]|nr:ABC transporter substrate-binding protein [Alphaproteobacteria bacterium]